MMSATCLIAVKHPDAMPIAQPLPVALIFIMCAVIAMHAFTCTWPCFTNNRHVNGTRLWWRFPGSGYVHQCRV